MQFLGDFPDTVAARGGASCVSMTLNKHPGICSLEIHTKGCPGLE